MAFSRLVRSRQQSRSRGGLSISSSLAGSDDESGYSSPNPTSERPTDGRSRGSTQSHNSLYRLFISSKADKSHNSLLSSASSSPVTASSGLRGRFMPNGMTKRDILLPQKEVEADFETSTATNTSSTHASERQERPSFRPEENKTRDRKNSRLSSQPTPNLSSSGKASKPEKRSHSRKPDLEKQHTQPESARISPAGEANETAPDSKAACTIYDRRRSVTKHRRASTRLSIGIPSWQYVSSHILPAPVPSSTVTAKTAPSSEQPQTSSITPSSLGNSDTNESSNTSLIAPPSFKEDDGPRKLDSPSTPGLPQTPQRRARHGRILSFAACEDRLAHIQHRLELSSDEPDHSHASATDADSDSSTRTAWTVTASSSRKKADLEPLHVYRLDAYIHEIIRRGRDAKIPLRDQRYLHEIIKKVQDEKTKREAGSTEDVDDALGFLDLASLLSSEHSWDGSPGNEPGSHTTNPTIPPEADNESGGRLAASESETDKMREKQQKHLHSRSRPISSLIPEDPRGQQYDPGSRLRHSQSLSLLYRGLTHRSPSMSSLKSKASAKLPPAVGHRRNMRNSVKITSDKGYWRQTDPIRNTARVHDFAAGSESSESSGQQHCNNNESSSRNKNNKYDKHLRPKKYKQKDRRNKTCTSLHRHAISTDAGQGSFDPECMSTSSGYSESSSSDLALPLPPPFKASHATLSLETMRKRNVNGNFNQNLNEAGDCSISGATTAKPSTYTSACTPPPIPGTPTLNVSQDKTSTHVSNQESSRNNNMYIPSPLKRHEQRKESPQKREVPESMMTGPSGAADDKDTITDTGGNPRINRRRVISRLSPKILEPLPRLLSPEAKSKARQQGLKEEEAREDAYISSASVSSVSSSISSTPSSVSTPSSTSWSEPVRKSPMEQKPAHPNPSIHTTPPPFSPSSCSPSNSSSVCGREAMLNIDAIAVSKPPLPPSPSRTPSPSPTTAAVPPIYERSTSFDAIGRSSQTFLSRATAIAPPPPASSPSTPFFPPPTPPIKDLLSPASLPLQPEAAAAAAPAFQEMLDQAHPSPALAAAAATVSSIEGTAPIPPPLCDSCNGQTFIIVSAPANVHMKDGECEARELFVVSSGAGSGVAGSYCCC